MADFKIFLGSEKNSEIIGRIPIAYCSKINKTSDVITAKNIIWLCQNPKLMYKMQLFLSTAYRYYKKIFIITPRLQKQTP